MDVFDWLLPAFEVCAAYMLWRGYVGGRFPFAHVFTKVIYVERSNHPRAYWSILTAHVLLLLALAPQALSTITALILATFG